MNALLQHEYDPEKPDAVFDLDGTVFKFTVIEQYINWLCNQQVFDPLPLEIEQSRKAWKQDHNNEENWKAHTTHLVDFFIGQIANKQVTTLVKAAEIVAAQTAYRKWDITRNLITKLRETHNVMAISLMPEWLMPPFVRNLGFVATLGCTYVSQDDYFTGEAYSIDKAEVYANFRDGQTEMLDIAMGDTIGDLPLLRIAKRPIAFNPSWTLAQEAPKNTAHISANKDLVLVSKRSTNEDEYTTVQLHCSEIEKVLEHISNH